MPAADNAALLPEAGAEYWGIDGSIVLYGVFADMLMMVPIILYMTLKDDNGWASHH